MQSITKYFNLSERQKEQFETLGTLYPEWKDIDNLYVNHILHSLSIAKFINPVDGTRILDMGTGGGFPGIPLAVMFPKCHFHLIDRIGKKINVARNIADSIKLDNVTFQHGDIAECRDKYDFVVSRAVMRLDGLLPLIKANIDKVQRNGYPNGLICLKGGDLNDETKSIQNPVIVEDINRWFDEPFFDTKKLVYVQM